MYATDIRQTDVRQHHCLMPPPRGRGINTNDKCQHNRISLSTALPSTDYFMSDSKFPTVSSVRDLDVIVDNRLTFRDHINSIVTRGHVRAS